jgi:hypothetical protein
VNTSGLRVPELVVAEEVLLVEVVVVELLVVESSLLSTYKCRCQRVVQAADDKDLTTCASTQARLRAAT